MACLLDPRAAPRLREDATSGDAAWSASRARRSGSILAGNVREVRVRTPRVAARPAVDALARAAVLVGVVDLVLLAEGVRALLHLRAPHVDLGAVTLLHEDLDDRGEVAVRSVKRASRSPGLMSVKSRARASPCGPGRWRQRRRRSRRRPTRASRRPRGSRGASSPRGGGQSARGRGAHRGRVARDAVAAGGQSGDSADVITWYWSLTRLRVGDGQLLADELRAQALAVEDLICPRSRSRRSSPRHRRRSAAAPLQGADRFVQLGPEAGRRLVRHFALALPAGSWVQVRREGWVRRQGGGRRRRRYDRDGGAVAAARSRFTCRHRRRSEGERREEGPVDGPQVRLTLAAPRPSWRILNSRLKVPATPTEQTLHPDSPPASSLWAVGDLVVGSEGCVKAPSTLTVGAARPLRAAPRHSVARRDTPSGTEGLSHFEQDPRRGGSAC